MRMVMRPRVRERPWAWSVRATFAASVAVGVGVGLGLVLAMAPRKQAASVQAQPAFGVDPGINVASPGREGMDGGIGISAGAAAAAVTNAAPFNIPMPMPFSLSGSLGAVQPQPAPPTLPPIPSPCPVDEPASLNHDSPSTCADHAFMRVVTAWATRVQIPAIANPTAHKWIYYSPRAVFNFDDTSAIQGGFADRINGIFAALLMCIQTNRALGVDWRFPANILTSLRGTGHVPWHLAPVLAIWPDNPESMARVACASDFSACASTAASLPDVTQQVILFLANQNWFDGVGTDARFLTRVLDAYQTKLCNLKLSEEFACLFDAMFVLRGDARAIMDRFEAAAPSTSSSASSAGEELTCVQLRMGAGGGQEWADSEQFLSPAQLPELAHVVRRIRAERSAAHSRVFLTSDSPAAVHTLMQLADLPESQLVGGMELAVASAVHIDRTDASRAAHALGHVVASFALFARCGHGIITERSGFGRLGLWRRGRPIRSDMSGRFFAAKRWSSAVAKAGPNGPTSSVIPFCEMENAGCVG